MNGFYNRDIDNLRAVADRMGVPVNRMYRGMQRRYISESGDFGGNLCYTYHPDYRPTNSQAVMEAVKNEIHAAYRSSTTSHQSATKKTTIGKQKGLQVLVPYLNALCEETYQKIVESCRSGKMSQGSCHSDSEAQEQSNVIGRRMSKPTTAFSQVWSLFSAA